MNQFSFFCRGYIPLFDSHFGQNVEASEAVVLCVGCSDSVKPFLHAIGKNRHDSQHVGSGFYLSHEMGETTKQGVVMLASHFYESRDGGTAGFFAQSPAASDQAMRAIDSLLRLDREWKV